MTENCNAAAQRTANDPAFPEHIAVFNPRWRDQSDGRRTLVGTSRRGSQSHLAIQGEIASDNLATTASIVTDNMKCLAWALRILAEESLGHLRDAENFRLFADISANVIDTFMDDFSEFVALADYVHGQELADR